MSLLLGLTKPKPVRISGYSVVDELTKDQMFDYQSTILERLRELIRLIELIRDRFRQPEEANPERPQFEEDPSIPLGVAIVCARLMWAKGYHGEGIKVAVIDTGILPHDDLPNVVSHKDYTGDSRTFNEHGTHVAGTIGANGSIKGVAYGCSLADYRVLDSRGSGEYDSITTAIRDAVDDGCHVINMSLGGPLGSTELHDAIKYAHDHNVVVCCAAGNSGDGIELTPERDYPAMYEEVISIGSADWADTKAAPSSFTNSNEQVDCCCQGDNVLSCGPDNDYLVLSGTSMATPHVAGVVALIIQQLKAENKDYTCEYILEVVQSLCKDIYIVGKDNTTGAGFVTFSGN